MLNRSKIGTKKHKLRNLVPKISSCIVKIDTCLNIYLQFVLFTNKFLGNFYYEITRECFDLICVSCKRSSWESNYSWHFDIIERPYHAIPILFVYIYKKNSLSFDMTKIKQIFYWNVAYIFCCIRASRGTLLFIYYLILFFCLVKEFLSYLK